MYKYLELEEHLKEQEIKNSFLPTIQLNMKRRGIQSIRDAKFFNKVLLDFYEKPELFKDEGFKPRIKLVDMLEFMKDDSRLLRESLPLEERLKNLKYCYEYIKKKKYISILTEDGKIARKSNIHNAYIVLTELGIKEFLNLDKKDFSEELNPFKEMYVNEYSFVLEENRKYIVNDYKRIKYDITSIFDENKQIFIDMYTKYYQGIKDMILTLITLSKEDANNLLKSITNDETHYIIRRTTTRDMYEGTYSLDGKEVDLDAYLNKIISNRITVDKNDFVSKQSFKIGSILKGRKYNIKKSILNENLESTLYFTLDDNAKFEITTKIVESISVNGTFFIRRPSTFHNVYYSNGEKLFNPSYEKLVREL